MMSQFSHRIQPILALIYFIIPLFDLNFYKKAMKTKDFNFNTKENIDFTYYNNQFYYYSNNTN